MATDVSNLVRYIKQANEAYRLGKPIISDESYDSLLEKLKKEDKKIYSQVKNELFENKGKFKHKYIVGSLRKITGKDEVDKFISENVAYHITLKLDGNSMILYYKNGKLDFAATRGDGEYGEIQTDKVRKIVPNVIKDTKDLVVRGEVIISKELFAKKYSSKYANARNFVAGILNRKEISPELDDLSFVSFEIMGSKDPQWQQIKYLKSLGFETVKNLVFVDVTFDGLTQILKSQRKNYSYEIDGLVISKDSYSFENEKYPIGKVAFKSQRDVKTTTIRNIIYSASRTGKIVPLLDIDPVEVDGSTISKVSAYNLKYVTDNKVGIGAIVTVYKAGEIIPKVLNVVSPSDNYNIPTHCPICKKPVSKTKLDIICTNPNCEAKTIKQVAEFIKNIGIKHISEKTLTKHNVKTFDQLLSYDKTSSMTETRITQVKDKIIQLDEKEIFYNLPFDGVQKNTRTKILSYYNLHRLLENDFKTGYPLKCDTKVVDKFMLQWKNYYCDITNKMLELKRKR